MNETFSSLNSLAWAILAINCAIVIGVGFFLFEFGWFAITHIVIGALGLIVIFGMINKKLMEIKN